MKMSLNRSYVLLILLRCLQHYSALPLYPPCIGLLLLPKVYFGLPRNTDARITPLTSGYVTELRMGRGEKTKKQTNKKGSLGTFQQVIKQRST